MAHIDGKLEHGKAIAHNFLAEPGSNFAVFFADYRKVEKNKYPHNPVLV